MKKIFENIIKNTLNKEDLKNLKYDENVLMQKISFSKREIYLTKITPEEADRIEKLIRFWNDFDEIYFTTGEERKPIKIFINCSDGGSLLSTFEIIDAIKMSKTPVYTINTGAAYREALYIYISGFRRYAFPHSSFLFKKYIIKEDESQQSNYFHFCKKQDQSLKEILLEKTKISETEYEKKEEWWIDTEKAYELKICNDIVRGRDSNHF